MFDLVILTPEEVYFKDKVYSVIAPGSEGYLDILTDHAPIITLLQKGDVIVTDQHKKQHYYVITGGVLEVHRNQASLLADAIESTPQPHISVSGLT